MTTITAVAQSPFDDRLLQTTEDIEHRQKEADGQPVHSCPMYIWCINLAHIETERCSGFEAPCKAHTDICNGVKRDARVILTTPTSCWLGRSRLDPKQFL